MSFLDKLLHTTTIASSIGAGCLFAGFFGWYGAIGGLLLGGWIGFKSLKSETVESIIR